MTSGVTIWDLPAQVMNKGSKHIIVTATAREWVGVGGVAWGDRAVTVMYFNTLDLTTVDSNPIRVSTYFMRCLVVGSTRVFVRSSNTARILNGTRDLLHIIAGESPYNLSCRRDVNLLNQTNTHCMNVPAFLLLCRWEP